MGGVRIDQRYVFETTLSGQNFTELAVLRLRQLNIIYFGVKVLLLFQKIQCLYNLQPRTLNQYLYRLVNIKCNIKHYHWQLPNHNNKVTFSQFTFWATPAWPNILLPMPKAPYSLWGQVAILAKYLIGQTPLLSCIDQQSLSKQLAQWCWANWRSTFAKKAG